MKTLQEQYNLIKEGKGHKGVFMKEAKRLFPNIVPNAATFTQTATLLKQRNVISERNNPKKVKATESKTTKEVSEKEIAGYDYKTNKNLDNQIFDQYIKGLRFEMEQNPELLADEPKEALLKAKDIVTKNLEKDPLFYMKNAAFGVKDLGYTELENGKEPTGKYKSSGYGDLKENKMNKSEQLKELLEEAVAGIPSIANPFADRKKATFEEKFAAYLAEEKKKDTTEAKKAKKDDDLPPPPPEAGGPGGFAINEKDPAKEEKKPKKEGKMKFEEVVKKAEKLGEMAKNKVMMEIYGSKKKELEETLNTINEDTNLTEFIDEGKIAAVQKEIALYEKYFMNAEANYNNMQ